MFDNFFKLIRSRISSPLARDIAEFNLNKQIEDAINKKIDSKINGNNEKPDNISLTMHPYALFLGHEWLTSQNTILSFGDLRRMANNPIIGSIIQTRLNQIAMFCTPSTNYDYGFKVFLENGDKEISKSDQDLIRDVTYFINNAGFKGKGDKSFESLMRKAFRDSLIIDQFCIEKVNRRNGLPAYMFAVDGATIRNLPPALDPNRDEKDLVYAQIIDENLENTYTQDQMIYGIRNPMTDLMSNGYGKPELEYLVNTITTLLNAEKVNSLTLEQGGTQRGVLVVKGRLNEKEWQSFRLDYQRAVKNASKKWEPPMINIDNDSDVSFVTLDRSTKDIEYENLYENVVRMATSVYCISPEEVNWVVGNSGSSVSFNSGAKDRLQFSQDKGLRPLLNFAATTFALEVVKAFDDRLSFMFTGLNTSLESEVDRSIKELLHYKTVNEVRVERGLQTIEGGDIILNQHFSSASINNDV